MTGGSFPAHRVAVIDDPADPRIAGYLDIRERDLVGREGMFIAEGEVVLRRLLGVSRHQLVSLFVARKRIEALSPLLAAIPRSVPVYAAGQAVMDRVVGFPLHRGILALGRSAPLPGAHALLAGLGPRAVAVVLVATANHDNMGGVFRNAAAFGAAAVLLDQRCCDPLYRKAIRVSVGATLSVPYARLADGEDQVAVCLAAGFEPVALSPAGATDLVGLRRPDRVAVFFGPEGPGLPESILAAARTVRIPMAPGFDSLNLATASGIVLHHFCRAEAPRG